MQNESFRTQSSQKFPTCLWKNWSPIFASSQFDRSRLLKRIYFKQQTPTQFHIRTQRCIVFCLQQRSFEKIHDSYNLWYFSSSDEVTTFKQPETKGFLRRSLIGIYWNRFWLWEKEALYDFLINLLILKLSFLLKSLFIYTKKNTFIFFSTNSPLKNILPKDHSLLIFHKNPHSPILYHFL